MSEFKVFFALAEEDFPSVEEDSILIWPFDTNWNDFGFNFKAQARWVWRTPQGEQRVDAFLSVVPWPMGGFRNVRSWIKTHLGQNRTFISGSAAGAGWLSILGSEDDYRTIVVRAGQEGGAIDRMLAPLHDIVHMRWRGIDREKLDEFLATEAAAKAVFRSSLTFQAWHGGIHVLKGMRPVYEDSRVPFEFASHLKGFASAHELSITFGSPPPLVDRCHALIGPNGAGKSRLLRELVIAVGRRVDSTATGPFGKNPDDAHVTTLQPPDFAPARVIALTWDAESVFPSDSRLDSPFQYQRFDMVTPAHADADSASSPETSETLTAVLVQLLVGAPALSGSFNALKAALAPVFDIDLVAVPLRPASGGAIEWIPSKDLQSGAEEKRLERIGRVELRLDPKLISANGDAVPLSSGQRVFLSFAIRCVGRMVPGSLLLLDEPETHLHPNLISEFMRMLASLLEAKQAVALIATHSPYVVRELPGRCVHIIQVQDRTPVIRSAFLRTLGANVDQLSVDIFGDDESRKLNADIASQIASSGLTFDEIRITFGREISSDMLSLVRALKERGVDAAGQP